MSCWSSFFGRIFFFQTSRHTFLRIFVFSFRLFRNIPRDRFENITELWERSGSRFSLSRMILSKIWPVTRVHAEVYIRDTWLKRKGKGKKEDENSATFFKINHDLVTIFTFWSRIRQRWKIFVCSPLHYGVYIPVKNTNVPVSRLFFYFVTR